MTIQPQEILRQTLFLMTFPESVTYIAEFGSLADIFPVSPCKIDNEEKEKGRNGEPIGPN